MGIEKNPGPSSPPAGQKAESEDSPGDFSFERVVDSALERVWDKKVQFSIRRLREMEAELLVMEKELDGVIAGQRTAGAAV